MSESSSSSNRGGPGCTTILIVVLGFIVVVIVALFAGGNSLVQSVLQAPAKIIQLPAPTPTTLVLPTVINPVIFYQFYHFDIGPLLAAYTGIFLLGR